MTPTGKQLADFAIKYYGVIANDADGTLVTPPTASPYVAEAKRQMVDDAGNPMQAPVSLPAIRIVVAELDDDDIDIARLDLLREALQPIASRGARDAEGPETTIRELIRPRRGRVEALPRRNTVADADDQWAVH